MKNALLITSGIVVVLGLVLAGYVTNTTLEENPFQDKKLLQRGMDKPVIWLYMDTSDVNSRKWTDFMGRSSRAINVPFLNLCYTSIVSKNKDIYRVEIINGLSDLAQRLGGWALLPVPLQNPIAPVGPAELNWIRAVTLKTWGGMWLDPATICIKPFGPLSPEKVVFFGTDDGETYAGPKGTPAPGLRCVWAGKAEHPVFVEWEKMARERVEARGGGREFRGDEKWDARQLAVVGDVEYRPNAELSRKANGRRIQIEDLLAAGQEGALTFDISEQSVYAPIPWPELRDRRQFGWFLRMSEDQIMESDLAISALFRLVG